jgi:hypothetical protein
MVTASWIIREKGTKRVICETFNKHLVNKLNTVKYEAVPILDYLGEFNANVRNQ